MNARVLSLISTVVLLASLGSCGRSESPQARTIRLSQEYLSNYRDWVSEDTIWDIVYTETVDDLSSGDWSSERGLLYVSAHGMYVPGIGVAVMGMVIPDPEYRGPLIGAIESANGQVIDGTPYTLEKERGTLYCRFASGLLIDPAILALVESSMENALFLLVRDQEGNELRRVPAVITMSE